MKKTLGSLGMVAWVMTASCGGESSNTAPRGGAGHGGSAGHTGGRAGAGRGGTSGSGGSLGGSAGGGSGGESGGEGGRVEPTDCSTDPTEIDGHTFQVDLARGDGDIPSSVFHFENGPSGLEVVVGTEGQAARTAVGTEGSRFVIARELRIRDFTNSRPWSKANGVYIESLKLCFHPPRDSSGSIEGKGTLLVIANADDYEDQWELATEFVAGPDVTAPTLPETFTLHPLEDELIPASEPLAPEATARLTSDPGTALEAVEMADVVVGFRSPNVLPLGVDSPVMTHARDLETFALKSGARVRTKPDPGVQALDGFESELRAVDYGYAPAELVTGGRALEGATSLLVPAGADTVLHLARPTATANKIRFELVQAPDLVQIPANIVVRAAVVGGQKIASVSIPVDPFEPASDTGVSGGGAAGAAGGSGGSETTTVELDLSEPGDDILLSIATPAIEESASALCGAIIDGLRVE